MKLLSLTWCLTSILIMYLSLYLTKKYHFLQLNFKEILRSLKSKSNNNLTPISSLCISLAAKIGVGSLSGIALAIYYGGVGTIFWLIIISIIVSINTYIECILGIKYREKIANKLVGGPSYYIKKCLNNKYLALIYSILIIITYSSLFLSIQTNTIITITSSFKIPSAISILILLLVTIIIISKGLKGISTTNKVLVPLMLIIYLILGIYVLIINIKILPELIISIITESFNIKSIIPVFLIGMQRAIFITESSLGTSAISASSCDNNPHNQALLEVLGIYITVLVVCLTTFIIIVTSDYQLINFHNINGIDIVIYAFNYHFGNLGKIILSIITIMFAFSTIISSYFFGDSNLKVLATNKNYQLIYKIFFLVIIFLSYYIKPYILWNLTDFFIAIIALINTSSILRIIHIKKV